MCQMRIVMKQGGKERVVLESAAFLEVTDEGILVNALFEHPKLLPEAVVTGIDFLQGRVTVTKQGERPEMNPKTTIEKLRVLLPHWIEHTEKHGVEFRQWAASARTEGAESLAELLDKASANMVAIGDLLKPAQADIGASGSDHAQPHPHPHHHDHGSTPSLPDGKLRSRQA